MAFSFAFYHMLQLCCQLQMTETIQTAMDRLMTISVEPQDYVAEDGLLYCGSCKTPKEAFFPNE